MRTACVLPEQTKSYLLRFYQILDDMIGAMTGAELTDSISHNFIVQMIPHHQAAIEMSRNALPHITGCALRRIAEGIITEQTQGIAAMRAALHRCAALESPPGDLALYQRRMDLIYGTMFREMGGAAEVSDIAADFMREMIPHHEGAIHMAKNALRYGVCPELVPILCTIISSQEKGVEEMRALLRRRSC
ncbi:DUF305 domain-containing protein [uncultured Dysosmobacter sp.]|uniref:DUF305 domain-containing protein n=1 Tax=uncultured Dysosmobacter sp. TaxID=2591384 RepID=UPI00261C0261|nr:DUF305 domain-containing protein [uncultured Dysosmobacter sp.]